MALHDDLLEQATHLARKDRKRPKQASLRRAVSAAYYALFHLLASAGAHAMAPTRPPALRPQVQRAFQHGAMKQVCEQFGKGKIEHLATRPLVAMPISADLARVARAFVDLQEARHRADYDVTASLIKVDVLQKIDEVRQAFEAWERIKNTPNANVFLAALLLQRHW